MRPLIYRASLIRSALLGLLLLGCDPTGEQGVEETGYFDGGMVIYSSAAPLSASAQEVFVVGLGGALSRTGGTLMVTNETTGAQTPLNAELNADGSFLFDLAASLGDELVLRYEVASGTPPISTLRVRLDDGLDAVAAPKLTMGTAVSLLGPGTINGQVNIDLSAIEGASPPYVAINQNTNDFVLIEDTTPVMIAASVGDTICLFQLDRTRGLSSPTLCEVVQ